MAEITFDVDTFREKFPEFATSPDDSTIEADWTISSVYISTTDNSSYMLTGDARELALYLLTAHIVKIGVDIAAGVAVGVGTQASIDKVSVSMQPPPVKDAFEYWLMYTPYGAQLLALLKAVTAGGLYIPGGAVPERNGFRTAGGGFGGSRWRR